MDKEELMSELEYSRTANQNKADLISISAHEIRTSLAAVKWSINVLIDGDFGILTKEQRALLERVAGSNERMLTIISDMLRVSQTDGSFMTFIFEPVDIVGLIDEVISDFTSEAHTRGVEISFTKPASSILIQADKLKLRGVIQNLIENAIKYGKYEGHVSVLINTDDSNVYLVVKDDGIGIPKSDHNKIFDKFFRADNAIKKEVAGYGLGLYSVKRILEKHSGTISFESEENKGTAFKVSIPLKKG